MSLALDYAPILVAEPVCGLASHRPLALCPDPLVAAPGWGRPAAPEPFALAPVRVLKAPMSEPGAWRLTRRGVLVVSLLVGAVGAVLVWLAAASAPAPPVPSSGVGPAVVTVQPGDTLWSLASQVAPGRDPGAEVAHLQYLNHLRGVDLVVGQSLHLR